MIESRTSKAAFLLLAFLCFVIPGLFGDEKMFRASIVGLLWCIVYLKVVMNND